MGLGLEVPQGVAVLLVDGFGGKYAAGDDGHIYCYSTARVNARKPKPFRIASFIGSTGYPCVGLVINGRKITRAAHVLVCLAFHGPKPSPVHEVRHLDGSRVNNKPDNLAWGTPAENEADKRRHGRTACGEKQGQAKLTEEAVRILRASIPYGLWNPVDAAKVFGVNQSTIKKVMYGETWRHVRNRGN